MNPSLSYVAPEAVGQATVLAGITPVSHGGDSIGGTIAVASTLGRSTEVRIDLPLDSARGRLVHA